MKIEVDQEMADVIFKKTLIEHISVIVDDIRKLLKKEVLTQWEIADLREDRTNLIALITIYGYTNIDVDRWTAILEELYL